MARSANIQCAVFANDGHPTACRPALHGEPGGHAAHLVGGFFPADVLHIATTHWLGEINSVTALTCPTHQTLQGQVAGRNCDGCGRVRCSGGHAQFWVEGVPGAMVLTLGDVKTELPLGGAFAATIEPL